MPKELTIREERGGSRKSIAAPHTSFFSIAFVTIGSDHSSVFVPLLTVSLPQPHGGGPWGVVFILTQCLADGWCSKNSG